ncbi:hypothetical protein [Novosphingobium sp.]|uniref:hypothetical protein n=1 Tax=Novosphingobium sp. TaxID=1874826 RepID=UPI002FD91A19
MFEPVKHEKDLHGKATTVDGCESNKALEGSCDGSNSPMKLSSEFAVGTARHRIRTSGSVNAWVYVTIPVLSNDDFGSREQMLFERAVARELSGDTDF